MAKELIDRRAKKDEEIETAAHNAPKEEGAEFPITARSRQLNGEAKPKPWVTEQLNKLQAGVRNVSH